MYNIEIKIILCMENIIINVNRINRKPRSCNLKYSYIVIIPLCKILSNHDLTTFWQASSEINCSFLSWGMQANFALHYKLVKYFTVLFKI